MATTVKPDGTQLIYTYDAYGHLTSLISSDGTVNHTLRHDKLGRLIAFDGIERTFDAKGRLLLETFSPSIFIQNTYDAQGRKVQTELPACKITYEYVENELFKVHCNGSTHTYLLRDPLGNVLEEKCMNGMHIFHTFDAASRENERVSSIFTQKVLERDLLGNILDLSTQNIKSQYH